MINEQIHNSAYSYFQHLHHSIVSCAWLLLCFFSFINYFIWMCFISSIDCKISKGKDICLYFLGVSQSIYYVVECSAGIQQIFIEFFPWMHQKLSHQKLQVSPAKSKLAVGLENIWNLYLCCSMVTKRGLVHVCF